MRKIGGLEAQLNNVKSHKLSFKDQRIELLEGFFIKYIDSRTYDGHKKKNLGNYRPL